MTIKNAVILFMIAIVIAGIFVFYKISQKPAESKTIEQITTQQEISGPKIQIEPKSYDLGEVIYGRVPERIFKISNVGDQPLTVLKLSTSCGCTKTSIAEDDKIIAPGQSVNMLVTFDPAVHKDDTDLGELVRVIYVRTDDPNEPEIEVEIRAKVVKE